MHMQKIHIHTQYIYGTKGKLLPKIEERNGTLIQNILTVTYVFLNQRRVNVHEHMTRIASLESF